MCLGLQQTILFIIIIIIIFFGLKNVKNISSLLS